MKCWLIQQLLSLYISGDWPCFGKWIGKHLEGCQSCAVKHQAYLSIQGTLQEAAWEIAPEFWNGYWETIQRETRSHAQKLATRHQPNRISGNFLGGLKYLSAIAAMALLTFLGWFWWSSTQEKSLPPMAQKPKVFKASSSPEAEPRMPALLPLPPAKQDVLLNVLLHREGIEYELDQARPIEGGNDIF